MKRYTKKDANGRYYIESVNGKLESNIKGHTYGEAIERFAELENADVAEVRRGEWQQNPYCKRIYFCSECGRHIEDGSNNPLEHFPYCHCGAKMDKNGESNAVD